MTRELKEDGEVLYDYAYDILTYRIKGREYARSVEFRNFTADLDADGFVSGIQIEDASQVLGIPKYALRDVRNARLDAQKDSEQILIELNFQVSVRNKKQMADKSAQWVQKAPVDMPDAIVHAVAV